MWCLVAGLSWWQCVRSFARLASIIVFHFSKMLLMTEKKKMYFFLWTKSHQSFQQTWLSRLFTFPPNPFSWCGEKKRKTKKANLMRHLLKYWFDFVWNLSWRVLWICNLTKTGTELLGAAQGHMNVVQYISSSKVDQMPLSQALQSEAKEKMGL